MRILFSLFHQDFSSVQQYSCRYSSKNRVAKMSGIVTISSGSESDLQSAVATVGPVSTYIDASHRSFQVLYVFGYGKTPDFIKIDL